MNKKNIALLLISYLLLAYMLVLKSEHITNLKHIFRMKTVEVSEAVFGQIITDRDDLDFHRNAIKMKKIISQELPNLKNASSDFDKLGLLRNWVNEQSVWGGKKINLKLYEEFNKKTAFEIYSFILANDDIKLDCGSYTIFLAKLYEVMGYEAYIYDMGRDVDGGHSVVLVRIHDKGGSKLIIEDPTYNITFTERDYRKPLDFFSLLHILRNNQYDLIYIRGYSGKGHRLSCSLDNECRSIKKTDTTISITPAPKRAKFKIDEVKNNLEIFTHYRYLRYFDNINLGKISFYKRLFSYFTLRMRLVSFAEYTKPN